MLVPILLLIAGLVILALGAESMVRGSASLALHLGISSLVVGLTVVAFGTSAPELVVSLKAAATGRGDIAAGSVLGSNLLNIGIILGISALISPIRINTQLLRFDVPVMVVTTLLMIWIFWDRQISRIEGLLLTAGLALYMLGMLWRTRRRPELAVELLSTQEQPRRSGNIRLDIVLVLIGLVLLVLGSHLLVENAVIIAKTLGVSDAVIGLTIVAFGTSMPELATSVVAALRKEGDIALGNIVGSNIFNLLAILGISGATFSYSCAAINAFDLYMMIGISLLLVPMLFTHTKLSRWEGLVLLLFYGIYLSIMWPR